MITIPKHVITMPKRVITIPKSVIAIPKRPRDHDPEMRDHDAETGDHDGPLPAFRRAAAAGWGSIDVLTDGVFREPCTFHLSQEALRAVDAAFDVNLLTPIRGQDRNGQDFEMTDILAGRGKLFAFYKRDGIVYRNEELERDFMLASRVEFDTPGAGVLENIHGLCAKVLLFGCVRVRSMVKAGETVEVRVGAFTSKTPLKPIQAWGTRSRSGR